MIEYKSNFRKEFLNPLEEQSTTADTEILERPKQTRSLVPVKKPMIIPARRNRLLYSKLATENPSSNRFTKAKYSEWEFEKLNIIFGTDSEPFMMFVNQEGLVHVMRVPLGVKLKNHQSIVRISGEEVLFAGGVNYLFNSVSSHSFILNLKTLLVRNLGGLSYRRFFAKIITLKKRIIIVGGREYGADREAILGYCEEYIETADKWERFPRLNVPRCNFSISVHGGKAIVIGGIGTNGKPIENLEVFSEKNDRWEMLGMSVRGGVIGHLSVSIYPELYIFGGVQKSPRGKLVIMDTSEGADQGEVKENSFPKKNVLSKSVVLGEKILILGGYHSNKFLFDTRLRNYTDSYSKINKYRPIFSAFREISHQNFNLSKCSNVWPLANEGYQVARVEEKEDISDAGIRYVQANVRNSRQRVI